MGNSFNFYRASFSRNSELGKLCILPCASQKGGGEKDLIHKALSSQSSLPASLPCGLCGSPPTSWVLKFKLALLCCGTGFTFDIHGGVLTMCQALFQECMDVRSFNLQMILPDKHYYFPHIPDEDSETESSCHLAKVTWLVGGDWNSNSETGSRTHAPDHL